VGRSFSSVIGSGAPPIVSGIFWINAWNCGAAAADLSSGTSTDFG
jgi:hypothetical protein